MIGELVSLGKLLSCFSTISLFVDGALGPLDSHDFEDDATMTLEFLELRVLTLTKDSKLVAMACVRNIVGTTFVHWSPVPFPADYLESLCLPTEQQNALNNGSMVVVAQSNKISLINDITMDCH